MYNIKIQLFQQSLRLRNIKTTTNTYHSNIYVFIYISKEIDIFKTGKKFCLKALVFLT